jgi:hypothetical protein
MKRAGSTRGLQLSGLVAFFLLGFLTALPWDAFAQSERKIPGMSLGSFKVSNNGAAEHSIPITVPPSFGPTPKLSISYNSQTGNGTLGVGWSLSGLSAIHRCPRTLAQDGAVGEIKYNGNDRFCLDGQRLMVINGLPYGSDGAEYRTELDTFVRVFSFGTVGSGPQHFVVKNKVGETMEFGNTQDSRIQALFFANPNVRVWALNKITDSSGNYLTISYDEGVDNGDLDYRPKTIQYAGNAAQGISPQRSVGFVYETRSDKSQQFMGGSPVKMAKRLKTIQTFAPPAAGGASVLVHEYRMTYESGVVTKRSRLKTITECAKAADGTIPCLPSHAFTWQEGQIGFGSTIPQWAVNLVGSAARDNLVGDFNGDGKTDIVSRVSGSSCNVHMSNGSGFNSLPWTCNLDGNGYNYVGDFDGDGKTDIVSFQNASNVRFHLSTGSSFNIISSIPAGLNTDATRNNAVGDFNGDGRADIVSYRDNGIPSVHLSNGNGFTNQQWGGGEVKFPPFSGQVVKL